MLYIIIINIIYKILLLINKYLKNKSKINNKNIKYY